MNVLISNLLIYDRFTRSCSSRMSDDKENIKKLLRNQFEKGINAAKATRNINEMVNRPVLTPRNSQLWYQKFREGRTDVCHQKGAGRPLTVNYRALGQRLRRNPDSSPLEISKGICSTRQTSGGYEKNR